MKAISRWLDRFCYNHPNFGIPNLMKYIVIGNVLIYFLDMFSNGYVSWALGFYPGLIFQGQIWRLITFVFIPESSGFILWFVMTTLLYYYIGNILERQWGTTRFTVFYGLGVLLNIIVGLVIYGINYAQLSGAGILADQIQNYLSNFSMVDMHYINMSLFFSFATLYPDALIRIYLILPVKAKWLAVLYVVLTVYDLLRSGLWGALFTLPQLLAVWLVYLVFFWDRIADLLGEFGFAVRHQNSSQTIHFKAAVKQQRKKAREQGYRHKCEVCGRTDTDFPDLQFRYCSKCAGYHCFCEDHIFNHTHFTQ